MVSAGVGAPSSTRLLGDRLAQATVARLAASGIRTELTTVELRDHAMDVTRNLLQGFPSLDLEEVMDTVTSADGAIFVTPIFSASYSGLFKSFIDILDPESIDGLPVLIAAPAAPSGIPSHSTSPFVPCSRTSARSWYRRASTPPRATGAARATRPRAASPRVSTEPRNS